MKHIMPRLCALLTAALLLAAAMTPAASAKTEITLQTILTNMGEMIPVPQTDRLMVYSEDAGLWGVFDTAGNQVMPYIMHAPEYVAYGVFADTWTGDAEAAADTGAYSELMSVDYTAAPEVNTNAKALVTPDGQLVSDYVYGVIRAYNDRWAAGLVVSDATEEAFDVKVGKTGFYNIERCDVFSLADEPRLAASFSREDFASAAAHGDYLSIADREGRVTVYDREMTVTGLEADKVSTAVYGVRDFAAINKVTGEVILDGCTACKELSTANGLLLQVTRVHYSGVKQNGLCTLDGEWVLPVGDYTVKSVTGDYALLAHDELQGLYSISGQRMIVPCEYESILTSKQTANPYAFYGYVCGVRGTARDWIDVATGEVVNSVQYDPAVMKTIGGTSYEILSKIFFGFTSAAGKTWRVRDVIIAATRGDGRLIVVQNKENSRYAVYTMNGDLALDFKYKNPPVITDDGKVILNSLNNGYQLIQIEF